MSDPSPDDRAAAIEAITARIAAAAAQDAATRERGPGVSVPENEHAARARDIVLRQLAFAPRPRAVLADKLRSQEIPDEVAGPVLDRYTELGLIDDRSYAVAYVTAKHRDRGLGRYALQAELRRKGVAEDDLRDAVDDIDTEAEARRATELIGKRISAAMVAGPEAARRRLLGQLSRRGYSPSLATRIVEEALETFEGG